MLSFNQLLELFIIFSTLNRYRYALSKVKSVLVHAEAKSGPVRPDTVPTGFWGAPFTAFQVIAGQLIPLSYIFTIVGNGLQQPPWMETLALPGMIFGIELGEIWKPTLRATALAVDIFAVNNMTSNVFDHLGDQYHPIGRREKPRVVQTGPYAWVRHPLYAIALLDAALRSIVFWSYVPLFGLVATAVIFSVKITIEEETIQRDGAIREEYRAYMRKVPARLIPYVW